MDSTNAEAKRQALSVESDFTPRLFIAREQTGGRGRMGRSFLSRAGRGIYISLLYFTDKPLLDAVSVTTAAAAIVAEAIEKATGNDMRIKWVNDIYNERGKVCGILAESLPITIGRVAMVVGIGINVGEDNFPSELKNIASSVGDVEGKEEELISNVVRGLLLHAADPNDRAYMVGYRERFMLMGETVELFKNGELILSGKVEGVDDDGGLIFVPDGKDDAEIIRSGEISVRIDK